MYDISKKKLTAMAGLEDMAGVYFLIVVKMHKPEKEDYELIPEKN